MEKFFKVAVRWIVLAFVLVAGAVTFAGPDADLPDWQIVGSENPDSLASQNLD